MTRPDIIFFDIDGTLLDFGKKDLSPNTREALLKLRENGIRICIATGRSPLALPKFAGVEFDAYLAYYGIDRSRAMAFGDGNNDIEMFQAVDLGIAMENASENLKAVAADTCGSVTEDGVYHYCKRNGLI